MLFRHADGLPWYPRAWGGKSQGTSQRPLAHKESQGDDFTPLASVCNLDSERSTNSQRKALDCGFLSSSYLPSKLGQSSLTWVALDWGFASPLAPALLFQLGDVSSVLMTQGMQCLWIKMSQSSVPSSSAAQASCHGARSHSHRVVSRLGMPRHVHSHTSAYA